MRTATAPITAAITATPINAVKKRGITVALFVELIEPVYNSLPDQPARIAYEPAVSAVQMYSKRPSDCVAVVPITVQGELLMLA